MTYRFRLHGIDVECDSIEELKAAANIRGFKAGSGRGGLRTTPESEGRAKQAEGPAKSWAEADAYAAKHGISRNEARSILAAEKKKLIEEALKKRKLP